MSSTSNQHTGGDAAAELPGIVQRYQHAHDSRDTDAALATFASAAEVVDDGKTAQGHEQIRHWLEHAASEFTYQRTLIEATPTGPGEWVVVNNLTGNFPGGTVDLTYRFTVSGGGLIQRLVIGPV